MDTTILQESKYVHMFKTSTAAHDVLHQRCEEQRYQQTADGDKGAEFYRRPEGVEIVAVVKQRDEIIQADKLAGETKRIDAL